MAEGEEEEEKNIGGEEKPIPLPPGYRFTPTDEELVEYYLLPRLQGRPYVPNPAIIDDYVYSRHPDDKKRKSGRPRHGGDELLRFVQPPGAAKHVDKKGVAGT